jgi:hypothetical protein
VLLGGGNVRGGRQLRRPGSGQRSSDPPGGSKSGQGGSRHNSFIKQFDATKDFLGRSGQLTALKMLQVSPFAYWLRNDEDFRTIAKFFTVRSFSAEERLPDSPFYFVGSGLVSVQTDTGTHEAVAHGRGAFISTVSCQQDVTKRQKSHSFLSWLCGNGEDEDEAMRDDDESDEGDEAEYAYQASGSSAYPDGRRSSHSPAPSFKLQGERPGSPTAGTASRALAHAGRMNSPRGSRSSGASSGASAGAVTGVGEGRTSKNNTAEGGVPPLRTRAVTKGARARSPSPSPPFPPPPCGPLLPPTDRPTHPLAWRSRGFERRRVPRHDKRQQVPQAAPLLTHLPRGGAAHVLARVAPPSPPSLLHSQPAERRPPPPARPHL